MCCACTRNILPNSSPPLCYCSCYVQVQWWQPKDTAQPPDVTWSRALWLTRFRDCAALRLCLHLSMLTQRALVVSRPMRIAVGREPEENLDGAADMLREFRAEQQQRREAGEGGQHSSDSDDALVEEPPRTKQKIERAPVSATGSNGKRKHKGKH